MSLFCFLSNRWDIALYSIPCAFCKVNTEDKGNPVDIGNEKWYNTFDFMSFEQNSLEKSIMLLRIKKIFSNPFFRSVLILLGGTTVAQTIPVLFSPILSRMFSPEQFGIYGIYITTINILTVLVCLKYDFAIVVAEEEREAGLLFWLCILIVAVFSVVSVAAFPFASEISSLFNVKDVQWVYLTPISVALIGINGVLTYYNIRLKQYKDITNGLIIKSIVLSVGQLAAGFLGFFSVGLIVAHILSFAAGNTRLIKNLRGKVSLSGVHFKEILIVAKKHSRYPKYTLAGSIANTMAYNIISYFLSGIYNTTQLGYYSMVNRALGIPLNAVGTSVGQVFMRHAAENKNGGDLAGVFSRVSRAMFFLSFPIFLLLYFFAPQVAGFVFGEEWIPAGRFIKILIPLFMIRFVVSPISTSALVLEKQKATMIWQICLIICSLIPVAAQMLFGLDIYTFLVIMTVTLSAAYAAFYLYCYQIIKRSAGKGALENG